MTQVSSVRWNNEALYNRISRFAELKHDRINAIINTAVTEYLENHESEINASELRRQTKYVATKTKSSELDEWLDNADTTGWK